MEHGNSRNNPRNILLNHIKLITCIMKKTIPSLKKELLTLISRYVKLYYSKGETKVKCFTCDSVIGVKTSFCQCGHCFSKSAYPAIQFNLDNQRIQCDRCNITLNGNEAVFKERLKEDIGEERFNWLESHKHDTIKLDRSEMESCIDDFKRKIAILEKNS